MLDWHIYIIMFQFQTGSIRSYERQAFMKALGVFQFQTGSIRRNNAREAVSYLKDSFNSKLVRLEVPTTSIIGCLLASFNSKLVRLEVN